MSLCRIYEWQNIKTVKLSDAYTVRIKMDDSSEYKELPECLSVSLPSYKYKEEIYKYGNNEKKFLIPDYTGLEDLSLDFMENYREDIKDYAYLRIQDLVNIFLNRLYDPTAGVASYNLTDYIKEIVVSVYKNNFSDVVIEYVFNDLKLTDYTKYDLDYTAADLAKWTLKFSYQSYYVRLAESSQPSASENAYNAGEAQYKAMQEAMGQAYRGGRGARTPREDQNMARRHEESLRNGESALDNEISEKKEERQQKLDEMRQLEMNENKVSTTNEKEALEAAQQKTEAAEKAVREAEAKQVARETDYKNAVEKHSEAVKNYEEGKTEGTTRRLREKNSELYDAEQLAAENRKAANTNLKTANAELAAAQEALTKAKEEETAAQEAYNKKVWLNSEERKQQEIDKLASEIDQINAEISDLNRQKQEQIEVAQGQQTRFQAERNSMSSEQKQRNARYQDSAEHAISLNETESVRDDWSAAAKDNAESETHSMNRQQMVGEEGFIKDRVEGRQKRFDDKKESREFAAEEASRIAQQEAVRPELAELEDMELDDDSNSNPVYNGMSETGKKIMDIGYENAKAEAQAEQKFAEKAGVTKTATANGEYIEVKNAAEIYKHPDYQERVTTLSMEMYKPGKSDPQMVYEKAQAQAMQEYLEGKLKLK